MANGRQFDPACRSWGWGAVRVARDRGCVFDENEGLPCVRLFQTLFLGAAGKKMGDFKAEMAYFTSKWGTRVVYG